MARSIQLSKTFAKTGAIRRALGLVGTAYGELPVDLLLFCIDLPFKAVPQSISSIVQANSGADAV